MNQKVIVSKLHDALSELLPTHQQADASGLAVSIPSGVDISKPLRNEEYVLWRDKYVHDFWMDKAWITRETDCPVETFKKAHAQTITRFF